MKFHVHKPQETVVFGWLDRRGQNEDFEKTRHTTRKKSDFLGVESTQIEFASTNTKAARDSQSLQTSMRTQARGSFLA
ncbi:MAG: hypothetical protein APF81_16060 [Desulfosporosinus sp. BRH_c37]|nr:MAG: hypothetical protein APF81_16060 [Desulfosporosinus sp. BRH_c37]